MKATHSPIKLRFLQLSLVFLAIFSFTSCGKTESDISEEVESGVVLVLNQSYYEFKLPNGNSLYFTSYNSENGIKGLSVEEDSVETAISYGTGFFISDDGLIATNAHVITSTEESSDIHDAMRDVFNYIKNALAEEFSNYAESYNKLVDLANQASWDDDYSASDYQEICRYRDACGEYLTQLKDTYVGLDNINVHDCDIIYHNEISVAFNDTYVTNYRDFHPCVIRKYDSEHDVAVIQLKDKDTPNDRYIFEIPSFNPLESYGLGGSIAKMFGNDKNEKLVLVGFNYGPVLALTEDGIKCQHTSGAISQESSNHLMYTIPSLHGSSGSPVLNMKGELVAINFAGLSNTQSFNYGVYTRYLEELVESL